MRNGRAGARELTVQLDEPNDLFEARGADVERGRASQAPGIESVEDTLRSRPRTPPTRLVIVVPRDKATQSIERGFRRAIARYCEARIAHAEHELEAIKADGWRTLLFGAVVLGIGLALSQAVLRSSLPKELRDFLGDGLFLVVAWVGLWYPLDTLIYSGRPYRHEATMLRTLSELEVVVRAAEVEPSEPAVELGHAPAQSLTGG